MLVQFAALPNLALTAKLYAWPEATGTPAAAGYSATQVSAGTYQIDIAEALSGTFKVIAQDVSGNVRFSGLVEITGSDTYTAAAAEEPEQQSSEDALAEALTGPKSANVDGVQFTEHSIQERIAADRYLKSQAASKKNHQGLRLTKIVSGGPA